MMKTFNQLSESELQEMATQIEVLKDSEPQDLYRVLGNALHDSGLTTSQTNDSTVLTDKIVSSQKAFNVMAAVDFVADTTALSRAEAETEGESFSKRFQEKLRIAICTDDSVVSVFGHEGSIKDFIKASIPIVVTTLGISVLSPLALVIISTALALLVKAGFATYCDGIDKDSSEK